MRKLEKRDGVRINNVKEAMETSVYEADAQLHFGNANTIGVLKVQGKEFCGIETGLPSMEYVDVISKTQLGIRGVCSSLNRFLMDLCGIYSILETGIDERSLLWIMNL